MVEILDLENFSDTKYSDDNVSEYTQTEKVSDKVKESLEEFNWIHTITISKLEKDKTCFACKKTLVEEDIVDNKMYLVRLADENVPNGSVVIVSVCKECFEKNNKE